MSNLTKRDVEIRKDNLKVTVFFALTILAIILVVLGLLFGAIWGWKTMSIWSKQQGGKAALAEAEYSKQVQVEEAKANLEAEKLNAQAEVERAKGAAEAIEIEGGNLSENYIRYLWVRNLEKSRDALIYVPTEGGIPLMEAGRGAMGAGG